MYSVHRYKTFKLFSSVLSLLSLLIADVLLFCAKTYSDNLKSKCINDVDCVYNVGQSITLH